MLGESAPARLPRRLALLGALPDQQPLPRYLSILIGGIADAGVEIDLLLPPGEVDRPLEIPANIQRFPLDIRRERIALADLRRYLQARRPSVILSNRDGTNALLARLAKSERPLTVLRIGTNLMERLRDKHLLWRWWSQQRLARTLAAADALIGVSEGACCALRELLRGRTLPPIAPIYNPVDLLGFRQLAQQPIDHPWLEPKEVPVVLGVGRLVRAKDYPSLIRAFRLVRNRLECRLVILGEGRQRSRLEALVRRLGLEGAVDLHGFVPNPFPYMARADLLVLSSVFEGNPNVLLEAMCVGTPCVATDCRSGPRETLADGRFGRLVPPGDTQALAEAMVETFAHPPDPCLLEEATRRFDRAAAIASYLRVLGLAPDADRDTP